jgi:hypothetical protein
MHLSPAHKDAAIRLLDRRPTDDEAVADPDDNIPRIKTTAVEAAGPVDSVGDGLETELRPEERSSNDG